MKQGRFIVFEGTEGAGKSTQLRHLQRWLVQSGWAERIQARLQESVLPLLATREPGGTELGLTLRRFLLDTTVTAADSLPDLTELLLYAADRAHHVQTVLNPALAAGTLVLCDRYTASTIAYQGYGRGLDLALIDQLNAIATGGLASDLTLWLDLPVTEGLARAKQRQSSDIPTADDRMETATLSFHERIQAGFAAIAQANPQQVIRIDATASEATVAHHIQQIVESHLAQWYPLPLVP